ncbi:MAG: tRNA pseudouridine(38-40) synthase TruA [Candidatus Omnitrophica bacterium]|nr:tRNA pseudouridine(38-40) synthase TruA [Candidatus Omnitrophota bacterium]
MRNIKVTVEYDGTNYAGWQVQNNQLTIQAAIEKALARILQQKVRVIGSGRTDSGVHALGQVANFKTKSRLKCENIQRALNRALPADIRIKDILDAQEVFHARFSAKSKLYRYTIVNHSFHPPHLRYYSYLVKYPLKLGKIRSAAQHLVGRHDLRSFQAVDKRLRPSVRTIKRLDVRRKENLIYLDIEADGFLYRMVRNIVGTLIEVGRGRLKPQDIKTILRAKNRAYAGPCAPAKGLCLVEVTYKN